jgi:hypothetical protein
MAIFIVCQVGGAELETQCSTYLTQFGSPPLELHSVTVTACSRAPFSFLLHFLHKPLPSYPGIASGPSWLYGTTQFRAMVVYDGAGVWYPVGRMPVALPQYLPVALAVTSGGTGFVVYHSDTVIDWPTSVTIVDCIAVLFQLHGMVVLTKVHVSYTMSRLQLPYAHRVAILQVETSWC